MKTPTANQRTHAIVMGASLGGLMTARALSTHFDRVTLIERDVVNRQPESRQGQPQTRHLHALLPGGFQQMMAYFPDLKQALTEAGANVIDFADKMTWYTHGGYRKSFLMNLPAVTMSRPLLEHLVRERVLALPTITLMDNCAVKGLTATADQQRVTGINIQLKGGLQARLMQADLIVDATGRGSRSSQWISALGYPPVHATEVKVKVTYATRTYKRDPNDPRGKNWFLYTPEAPQEKHFGVLVPAEGDRWIISVGGWHSDIKLTNPDDFDAFVRQLPMPDLYDIIRRSEPLSDPVLYNFSSSLRRHYEKMDRFPLGYLVLGDAFSNFNPTYGQGMTSATMQAAALDDVLTEGASDQQLASRFFKRAATVVDTPWQLAVGEDLRYPQTVGIRPAGTGLLNAYITRVQRATLHDEVVCAAFLRVMSLIEPPATLFHPRILWRVIKSTLARQRESIAILPDDVHSMPSVSQPLA